MSNVLSFSTRFGQDGELKTTQGGTEVLTVRCPVESGWGDKKHTSWITAVLFGKRATGLAPHIQKGGQATIWGELRVREYDRKDGGKGTAVECIVDKIDLQGGKSEGKPSGTQSVQAPAQQSYADNSDGFDTDVPF